MTVFAAIALAVELTFLGVVVWCYLDGRKYRVRAEAAAERAVAAADRAVAAQLRSDAARARLRALAGGEDDRG